MSENGGPAFPVVVPTPHEWYHDNGMTLRQYAAISLRVPESGEGWLDRMIEESRRLDLAGQALAGWLGSFGPEQEHPAVTGGVDIVAEQAHRTADAMLAAREAKR